MTEQETKNWLEEYRTQDNRFKKYEALVKVLLSALQAHRNGRKWATRMLVQLDKMGL